MKPTISLLLLIVMMFASCGEQKKNAKEELYEKVMAIHDEIMPKMGAIMKYKKQLNGKIDALIEEDADANADKIAELTKAIADLDNSHKEMMNWMHGFDPDFEGKVKEEVMKYLKDQENKIESVAKITNNALKNAEELLAN